MRAGNSIRRAAIASCLALAATGAAAAVSERQCQVLTPMDARGGYSLALIGSPSMPAARGEARLELRRDEIRLEISAKDLSAPERFGNEYLTFVAWSAGADGTFERIGELERDRDRSRGRFRLERGPIGIVVTAEPYAAVPRPSDTVILRAVPGGKAARDFRSSEVACAFAPADAWTLGRTQDDIALSLGGDEKTPGSIVQARNAIEIARRSGADAHAEERLREATRRLLRALDLLSRGDPRDAAGEAYEAVLTAESARRIAGRRIEEETRTREELEEARRTIAALEREIDEAWAAASDEGMRRAAAERKLEEALSRPAPAPAPVPAAPAALAYAPPPVPDRRLEEALIEARLEAEKARLEADHARRVAAVEVERARLEAERKRFEQVPPTPSAPAPAPAAALSPAPAPAPPDPASAARLERLEDRIEAQDRRAEADRLAAVRAEGEAARARDAAERAREEAVRALVEGRSREPAPDPAAAADRERTGRVETELERQQAAADAKRAEEERALLERIASGQAALSERQEELARLTEQMAESATEAERAALEAAYAAKREALDADRAALEAERAAFEAEARAKAEAAERAREARREEWASRVRERLARAIDGEWTDRGLVVRLADGFAPGSERLRPEARSRLERVVTALRLFPGLTLEVEGHTDDRGGAALNQSLSERRARSVAAWLVESGWPSESVAARGLGETAPIADNATAEGRRANRRVELILGDTSLEDVSE